MPSDVRRVLTRLSDSMGDSAMPRRQMTSSTAAAARGPRLVFSFSILTFSVCRARRALGLRPRPNSNNRTIFSRLMLFNFRQIEHGKALFAGRIRESIVKRDYFQ